MRYFPTDTVIYSTHITSNHPNDIDITRYYTLLQVTFMFFFTVIPSPVHTFHTPVQRNHLVFWNGNFHIPLGP